MRLERICKMIFPISHKVLWMHVTGGREYVTEKEFEEEVRPLLNCHGIDFYQIKGEDGENELRVEVVV